jgi:hypothetical protein
MLIKKLLSLVDQTKKDLKMDRWMHVPLTSFECQYYNVLHGTFEAESYVQLGSIACMTTLRPVSMLQLYTWRRLEQFIIYLA